MKKYPYCAEEMKDEPIVCRCCGKHQVRGEHPNNLRLPFYFSNRGLWYCSSVLDIHKQIPNSVDDIRNITWITIQTNKMDQFWGGRSDAE